jgi:CDP-glucose 4,6-dehydratase
MDDFRPEVVIHLAAQALVRRSYADPATTFEVNTLGAMNVLECVRRRPWIRALVVVTSDKCYRNVEWAWGYRETDTLGGEDPYSGSKGAAEVVAYSYIHSYFMGNGGAAAVATARAGNVIGGGDWAEDRIVPDCLRSWSRGSPVVIRHPEATRPWQHVLEPLSGYLWLGARLWERAENIVGQSYNFGPDATVNQSVEALLRRLVGAWPGARWEVDPQGLLERPESRLLKLSCDKALADLGWRAVLTFDETVEFTVAWYREYYQRTGANMLEVSRGQIAEYCRLAGLRTLAWSAS